MVKMSLQPVQVMSAELPEQLPLNCSSNGARKGSWEDVDAPDRAVHQGPPGTLGPQATMPTHVSLYPPV